MTKKGPKPVANGNGNGAAVEAAVRRGLLQGDWSKVVAIIAGIFAGQTGQTYLTSPQASIEHFATKVAETGKDLAVTVSTETIHAMTPEIAKAMADAAGTLAVKAASATVAELLEKFNPVVNPVRELAIGNRGLIDGLDTRMQLNEASDAAKERRLIELRNDYQESVKAVLDKMGVIESRVTQMQLDLARSGVGQKQP